MGNFGYGAFPIHPGEVLKDELEERGISRLHEKTYPLRSC